MKKAKEICVTNSINYICDILQLMQTPIEIFEHTTSKTCGRLIDMYCKEGSKVVCINYDEFGATFEMFKIGDDNTLVNCVELSFESNVIHELERNIVAIITNWATHC